MKKKKIQNKNYIQKIIMMLLIVVSMSMVCPSISLAANPEDKALGGTLIGGVSDLITALGDGILNIIHRFIMNQEDTLVHLTGSGWQVFGTVMIAVVAALIAGAIIIWSAGLLAPILGAIGITVSGISIAAATIVGSTAIGYVTYANLPKDELDLPIYSISPEEIFYGKIPLLNVNFFNPEMRKSDYNELFTEVENGINKTIGEILIEYGVIEIEDIKKLDTDCYYIKNVVKEGVTGDYEETEIIWIYQEDVYYLYKIRYLGLLASPGDGFIKKNGDFMYYLTYDLLDPLLYEDKMSFLDLPNKEWYYENLSIKNILDLDDIQNFKNLDKVIIDDNEMEWRDQNGNIFTLTINGGQKKLTTQKTYSNIASDLQPVVSKWYVTLRNVALVVSMSILVYVGIRMMLTSIASEKAKYKTMLFDWLIGIALIFVMQYIMIFGTNLNDQFINTLAKSETIYSAYFPKNTNLKWSEMPEDTYKEEIVNGQTWIIYPTNLMGQVRIGIQNMRDGSLTYAGYAIMFLVLVFYTAFFIFTYMKRVIYMAFLTIIAPFVAMTYSIDKLNDGKAQAFNLWLKEYIFNLLIQPMHLLLYYILVVSAIELVESNYIYGLVAIGFLIPAEKLIRKFFGFDKAQTPGLLGGAAGAGLVMSAVGSLKRFANPGKSSSSGKTTQQDGNGKIRTKSNDADKLDIDNMFNDSSSSANRQNLEGSSSGANSSGGTGSGGNGSGGNDSGGNGSGGTGSGANSSGGNGSGGNGSGGNNTSGNTTKPKASDKKKRGIGKSIAGATGAVITSGARGAVRLTGKIPSLAAKGFGAATLGAVGLAAGIATGDASNALQYGLTGAGVGSALGGGLLNRAANTSTEIADDAVRGWYGDEYEDKYLNKQSDRQFMASKENQNFYKSMFGDNWKDAMKLANKDYRSQGITDNKIIAKAMKLEGYGDKEKVAIANLASQINSREDWAYARKSMTGRFEQSKIDAIEKGVFSIKKWKI